MDRQPPAGALVGCIMIRLPQGDSQPYFHPQTPDQEMLLRGVYALLMEEPPPTLFEGMCVWASRPPDGTWELLVELEQHMPATDAPYDAWARPAERRLNTAPGPDRILWLAGEVQRLQEEQARIRALLQTAVPSLFPDDAPAT